MEIPKSLMSEITKFNNNQIVQLKHNKTRG